MAKKTIVGDDGKEYIVKEKKPFYKKWWFIAIVAIVVIWAIGGQNGNKPGTNDVSSSNATSEDTVNKSVDSGQKEVETPDVPKEYLSALEKAKTYATSMYMSKQSVHEQLVSEYGEKFSKEAADWAMENLTGIDWKQNALMKAKTYQDEMSMSPEAIRGQLSSPHGEKFTQEEADWAIANLDK